MQQVKTHFFTSARSRARALLGTQLRSVIAFTTWILLARYQVLYCIKSGKGKSKIQTGEKY